MGRTTVIVHEEDDSYWLFDLIVYILKAIGRTILWAIRASWQLTVALAYYPLVGWVLGVILLGYFATIGQSSLIRWAVVGVLASAMIAFLKFTSKGKEIEANVRMKALLKDGTKGRNRCSASR